MDKGRRLLLRLFDIVADIELIAVCKPGDIVNKIQEIRFPWKTTGPKCWKTAKRLFKILNKEGDWTNHFVESLEDVCGKEPVDFLKSNWTALKDDRSFEWYLGMSNNKCFHRLHALSYVLNKQKIFLHGKLESMPFWHAKLKPSFSSTRKVVYWLGQANSFVIMDLESQLCYLRPLPEYFWKGAPVPWFADHSSNKAFFFHCLFGSGLKIFSVNYDAFSDADCDLGYQQIGIEFNSPCVNDSLLETDDLRVDMKTARLKAVSNLYRGRHIAFLYLDQNSQSRIAVCKYDSTSSASISVTSIPLEKYPSDPVLLELIAYLGHRSTLNVRERIAINRKHMLLQFCIDNGKRQQRIVVLSLRKLKAVHYTLPFTCALCILVKEVFEVRGRLYAAAVDTRGLQLAMVALVGCSLVLVVSESLAKFSPSPPIKVAKMMLRRRGSRICLDWLLLSSHLGDWTLVSKNLLLN